MADKRKRPAGDAADELASLAGAVLGGEAQSAAELKEAGNRCFHSGDWAGAAALYTNALGRGADADLSFVIYLNRSACELELASGADGGEDAARHFQAAAADAQQAQQLMAQGLGAEKRAKVLYRLGKARLGVALCDLRRLLQSTQLPMIGTGEEATAALEHRMAAEAHGVAGEAVGRGLRAARAILLEARELQPSNQELRRALADAERALGELGLSAEPPAAALSDAFPPGVSVSRGPQWVDNRASVVVPAATDGGGADAQLPLCLVKRYAPTQGAAAATELHVDLTFSAHCGHEMLAAAAAALARAECAPADVFCPLSEPSGGCPALDAEDEFVLDAALLRAQQQLVLALEAAQVIERVRIGCNSSGQMRHVCRVRF